MTDERIEFLLNELGAAVDRLHWRVAQLEERLDMRMPSREDLGVPLAEGLTPEKADILRQMLPSVYGRKPKV